MFSEQRRKQQVPPLAMQPEAADPAESICEQCAADDGEPRDCGHVICEKCFAGGCPVCDEDRR
jgi:hypothetical protein